MLDKSKKELLAERLNGIEYPCNIYPTDIEYAKSNGLIIFYGASDDLMEIEGCHCDEVGCWNGCSVLVDHKGVLTDRSEIEDDDELFDFFKRKDAGAKHVVQQWDTDGLSWCYKTDIPHAVFNVMEDGDVYCKGIVISLLEEW